MNRWGERAAVGASVVVALALGQVISSAAADQDSAARPFVRTGEVGDRVHLEYADVAVTDVLMGRTIATTEGGFVAAGRFLVLDTELTPTRGEVTLAGVYVLDSEGRAYLPDARTQCAQTATPFPGTTAYARFCIDVPQEALAGASLVVARGPFDIDGAYQRRDDLARIDLGIDSDEAAAMWRTSTETAYGAAKVEYEPLDTAPFQPKQEQDS